MKTAVPALRERGFTGAFPHFRRRRLKSLELLSFQFDKWGSGDFVVEIAKCPGDGFTTSWGEFIPPSKVNVPYLHPRLRLGAKGEDSDHWFKFRRLSAECAKIVQLIDTQAEQWWHAG